MLAALLVLFCVTKTQLQNVPITGYQQWSSYADPNVRPLPALGQNKASSPQTSSHFITYILPQNENDAPELVQQQQQPQQQHHLQRQQFHDNMKKQSPQLRFEQGIQHPQQKQQQKQLQQNYYQQTPAEFGTQESIRRQPNLRQQPGISTVEYRLPQANQNVQTIRLGALPIGGGHFDHPQLQLQSDSDNFYQQQHGIQSLTNNQHPVRQQHQNHQNNQYYQQQQQQQKQNQLQQQHNTNQYKQHIQSSMQPIASLSPPLAMNSHQHNLQHGNVSPNQLASPIQSTGRETNVNNNNKNAMSKENEDEEESFSPLVASIPTEAPLTTNSTRECQMCCNDDESPCTSCCDIEPFLSVSALKSAAG